MGSFDLLAEIVKALVAMFPERVIGRSATLFKRGKPDNILVTCEVLVTIPCLIKLFMFLIAFEKQFLK